MSERLDYVQINDDQLVVQLTHGGAAARLVRGASLREVTTELRDLADRLERGVAYRAGLRTAAEPTRREPELISIPLVDRGLES